MMDAPFSEPFFTGRKMLLSRPDDFMLFGKLGVDFFSFLIRFVQIWEFGCD